MQPRSVDPTRGASAVGPVDDLRIGTSVTDPVAPIGQRPHSPASRAPSFDQVDRMEVHVGGTLRRAYAQFMAHPESGVVSIKIVDADTEEVIREIPSEEVIKLAEQLQSYWTARLPKREGA